MANAKIIVAKMSFKGAEPEDVWIVEGEDEVVAGDEEAVEGEDGVVLSRTIFMGHDASAQATKYARARFGAINIVMKAETGHFQTKIPDGAMAVPIQG